MIIKVACVFDCSVFPAQFYRIYIKTQDSKAIIAKYVPDENDATKSTATEIMTLPVMQLTVAMDQFDRHLWMLEQKSCLVQRMPVKSNPKEIA